MNAQDILKIMQSGDISSLAGVMGGNMAALAPLLKNRARKRADPRPTPQTHLLRSYLS